MTWYRAELCRRLFKHCRIHTLQADNVLEAIRTLERNPELTGVVADLRFPTGPDGIALLETAKARWPHMKRMLLSAYTDGPLIELGYERGHLIRDKALSFDKLSETICDWLKAA